MLRFFYLFYCMNFRQIASFDNFILANMTLGLLHENGINCHLKDEHIVTVDPLLNPAVGGIKLFVAEEDYHAAEDLIKTAEEEYVKGIACPRCKAHALTIEEEINNPAGLWPKLWNKILYGQSSTYKKQYFCTNCHKLFDQLPPSF